MKRKNIQTEVWEIWGEQSTCSRLLCVWFTVMPLIGVFCLFLTLYKSLLGKLHVIIDCFLSLSLSCLLLPHISVGSSKSISFLLHPEQKVVGTDSCTACSVASDSPQVFRAFLTCSADEHWIFPAPGHSSTLTVIFSPGSTKHTERLEPSCRKEPRLIGLIGCWDLSEDNLMHWADLTFTDTGFLTYQHRTCWRKKETLKINHE